MSSFTAHDLRYHLEATFPALSTYLHHRAQRHLGPLQFNSDEVDLVVEHVIEQLVRMGVAGGGDKNPPTLLDSLNTAQFFAFINRSVRNKAIDRLRKNHYPVSTFSDMESPEGTEENLLNEKMEPLWGPPLATPEEIAIKFASNQELRERLKHCIENLKKAPHQLQAVLQELEEIGATTLLQAVTEDLKETSYIPDPSFANSSQHKDHAHRKLRLCLQRDQNNLTMLIAARLTEYGERTAKTNQEVSVALATLTQNDLTIDDVRMGLKQLTFEGILDWHGEETVQLTSASRKQLARFYRPE